MFNIKIGDYMKITKKTKKAGALAGIFVILIIILGIFLPGLLEPTIAGKIYPDEHLFVDKTYLLKTDETNDTVNVTCNLYITNTWKKESGEIKAIAYVIETKNNFAVFKTDVEIDIINAESTTEVEIPVALSNNSYKIDVLLFENGKLVITGELTISARPIYSWEDIERGKVDEQKWDVYNSGTNFYQIR